MHAIVHIEEACEGTTEGDSHSLNVVCGQGFAGNGSVGLSIDPSDVCEVYGVYDASRDAIASRVESGPHGNERDALACSTGGVTVCGIAPRSVGFFCGIGHAGFGDVADA